MAKVCVKCRVMHLTSRKLADLDHEYEGFQRWMILGEDTDILSQHKRAKGYNYKLDQIKYKEYPLIIPKKQIRYRRNANKLAQDWVKISVRKRKGIGIWLPLRPHKKLPSFDYNCDSLLIKNRKGYYELRLIFDVPVALKQPKEVIAIDFGERNIATVLSSASDRMFLGREIRGLRAHYSELRRKLGRKKLLKKIRSIGNKERRIISGMLHQIANTIIRLAEQRNAIIVMGNLRRFKRQWSKKLNRMLSSMPFYKLKSMIEYKADQRGIQHFEVSEYRSSITCHHCGHVDRKSRASQGLFRCTECGLECNADLNACHNHLKKADEQDLSSRAMAYALEPASGHAEQAST